MADDTQRPIVIKRIKKSGGAAHGGAWKIAYADFVTAMMAFFLLMWLLGSVNKAKLQGISDYFKTPMRVALTGGAGAGQQTSLIQGGGEDITKKAMDQKASDDAEKSKMKPEDGKTTKPEVNKEEEKARLNELKQKLDKLIESNPKLQQFKNQIKIDITSEGLRIQIVDDQNRPMFDSGSAVTKAYTRDILREIGRSLNDVPNRISLSGHTDSVQYASGLHGYSNWELSADRANASRRELLGGGLRHDKILRVVGLADAVPFSKEDPSAPINRRISIIVMKKEAEEAITKESQQTEALTAKQVGEKLGNIKP
ncbi:MAG: flagellar motor protein MotB [Betaproteobacteria bacterium]|nr:flagellar motor protein MotB [Betaproteobacteria bacterium]